MKQLMTFVFCLIAVTAFATSQAGAEGKRSSESKSWSRPYGMAGCGLGSLITGKKGGQLFAGTFNSTAYNQMFGITSGTSNCIDNPNSEVAHNVDRFVVGNQVSLASDIARGRGETLAGLSRILGCKVGVDHFGAVLQKNFGQIFPDAKVQPNEVTDSIITIIINDSALSQSCNVVG